MANLVQPPPPHRRCRPRQEIHRLGTILKVLALDQGLVLDQVKVLLAMAQVLVLVQEPQWVLALA